jgi:hypothetical protein
VLDLEVILLVLIRKALGRLAFRNIRGGNICCADSPTNRKWLETICTAELLPVILKYRPISPKEHLEPELERFARKEHLSVSWGKLSIKIIWM